MKVAILGGGLTGLTAGYYYAKDGNQVTIFEKEAILGGMAAGFKKENWRWPLERAYHHLFANDFDILNFAKEIGFDQIFFKSPETASLYKNSKFSLYPLDTPIDFLRFPLISWPEKIRAGAALAFLKVSPFFSFYEKTSSAEFLEKIMGRRVWQVLWQPLFEKKFGRCNQDVLASFIWARIKKRTKNLGYIRGGFQALIDYLDEKNKRLGVSIKKNTAVDNIKKRGSGFLVNKEKFDLVISTLPTPILIRAAKEIFPSVYLQRLTKIKYLHAANLILETKEKLFGKTYWANIAAKTLPFMILVQQTNFIDKKYYGGNHILYVGKYIDAEDPLFKMTAKEALNYYLPLLKRVNPTFSLPSSTFYLFKAPFAQPIFNKDFLENKPDFETPLRNFYIANLDMTYPYDRGTNFAVKLGKEVYLRSLR